MRVAIMHYHLRSGGVTTVIRDQLAALAGRLECIVLTGEHPASGMDSTLGAAARVVPGIGYAEPGEDEPDARTVARAIRRAMMEEWGAPADLLHVHNPTLNKNPAVPDALRLVQEEGVPLLAQVHDLAEDNRPSAFFPISVAYPADCHYGVINSRDRDAFIAAGLRPTAVHLMWNLVRAPRAGALRARRRGPMGPPALVYPVRAIRRKNIGEAILLATLLRGRLSVTLPPVNDVDLARYSRWKDFARDLDLPIRFDAGLDRALDELMAEADVSVSTSLNEGFGFALLEPWTAGLPVGGRRIAHVCDDFENEGVAFPWMYESLQVPVDLLDVASFFLRWKEALSRAFQSFGRSLDETAMKGAWSEMIGSGSLDFGALDEQGQREVIIRALSDQRAREALGSGQVGILRKGLGSPDPRIIEKNKAAIEDSYGSERYGRTLEAVYQAVRDTPVRHSVDRPALLDGFLHPRRFRILEQR